jgi:predicted nucleic acid-binding Zn ribbon protein
MCCDGQQVSSPGPQYDSGKMSHPPRLTSPILPTATAPVHPEPEDHCVRCGRPTPAGVSLCEADNPGAIKAPSATQVHGTILVGVVAGFLIFGLLARFAVSAAGPFEADIQGRAPRADGAAEVVVRVVNAGTTPASATCRVTRDGVPRQEDLTFRTERLAAGATVQVTRTLPVPVVGDPAFDVDRVTVACT